LLTCLNADGSLDTNFGTNGVVSYAPGGNGLARGVALQSDGKIVAAGMQGSLSSFAVVRFLGDSTPLTRISVTLTHSPTATSSLDPKIAPLVLEDLSFLNTVMVAKRHHGVVLPLDSMDRSVR